MNLTELKISEFHSQFKRAVQNERAAEALVIQFFEAADRRKIYAEMGYPSMMAYAIKELGYSEPEAQRRIDAARFSRQVPEVKEKIARGEMTLSTVCQAATFIRQSEKTHLVKKTVEEKREILKAVENKTYREVERVLADLDPEVKPAKKPQQRAISGGRTQIVLHLSAEEMEAIEKLQDLMGKTLDPRDLMMGLVNKDIERLEIKKGLSEKASQTVKPARNKPNQKAETKLASIYAQANQRLKDTKSVGFRNFQTGQAVQVAKTAQEAETIQASNNSNLTHSVQQTHKTVQSPSAPKKLRSSKIGSRKAKPLRAYIGVKTKREVLKRAEHRCEFVDPVNGRRCEETRYLQQDHILPVALGGTDDTSNLRILCSAHNRLRAEKTFGPQRPVKFDHSNDRPKVSLQKEQNSGQFGFLFC